MTQARQPKGTVRGGQFATTTNDESLIDLSRLETVALPSEEDIWRDRATSAEATLNRIVVAARNQNFSGADLVQEVCDILTTAGFVVDWDLLDNESSESPESVWGEWSRKYVVQKNHLVADAPFGGTMFETSGDQLDFVKSFDPHQVWTITDQDGTSIICPGFHSVNRLGYMITDVPWDESTDSVDLHDGVDDCPECGSSNITQCDDDGRELVNEDDWDGWRRCLDCDNVW